ncbi:MAG: DUF4097 family beta strand repeat protein [Cyclobacteriaceae bacterium]|nr:DUF4097 family beta strand repeat protein [Cyclobacteriaceae bacterium]
MKPQIILFSLIVLFSGFTALMAQNTLAEADFSLENVRSLEVRGKFCNVEINGSKGKALEFDGYIRGTGNPDGYEIKHERRGDLVEVWVETPMSVWGNLESLLKFQVPAEVDVTLENSSGNLKVYEVNTKMIGLEITSGNIETGNTSGELEIECSSGNVTVNGQQGNLQVKTTSGNIRVKDVQGVSGVEASSGNINLDNLDGDTRAECTSGNITMNNIRGKLYAETSSGNIRGDEIFLVNEAEFRATSGNIKLDLVNREDELSFELEAGSGNLKAAGSSGEDELIVKRGGILVRGVTSSGNQTYNTR